jgi:hypothetical protein
MQMQVMNVEEIKKNQLGQQLYSLGAQINPSPKP